MDKYEIVHVIIILFYCIIIILSSLFVYIYMNINSMKSYQLVRRRQDLLSITTLGVITLGPLEIYGIGFNKTENFLYILIKSNIYYITVTPCFISYCYRGLFIYFNYKKNIEYLYNNKNKVTKINNKLKIIKKGCFIICISFFIYAVVIDILYYYNVIKNYQIIYYPYYVIVGIYGFIMHPLIIYLLYKIGNNLKYDYIYTMFVIGIYYSIIMLCNFINVEYKIIKNYPGALAGFFCYIGYLIIPLIYITVNRKKNNNNNNNIKNTHIDFRINKKILNIELFNIYIDYLDMKKNIFNFNDFKKTYKIFYENKIKIIKNIPLVNNNKHYEKIVKKIEIIDKNLEDDHFNIDKFEELFKRIHDIILIDLYEKNNRKKIIVQ